MKRVVVRGLLWGLLVWSAAAAAFGVGSTRVVWLCGVGALANIFLLEMARLTVRYRSSQEDLRRALDKLKQTGLPEFDGAEIAKTMRRGEMWCGQLPEHPRHNHSYQVAHLPDGRVLNSYIKCSGSPGEFSQIDDVEAFLQED